MLMRWSARNSSRRIGTSFSCTTPSGSEIRGAIVSCNPCGCSKISLIMWWGNSRFSAILCLLLCHFGFLRDLTAHNRLQNVAVGVERDHVRDRARNQFAAMCRQPDSPGGIQRGQAYCLLQVPVGKLHDIADCLIHGQNAACELAVRHALAVSHVDL